MPRMPWKNVLLAVGAVAIVGGAALAFGAWHHAGEPPEGWSAPNPAVTAQDGSASGTEANPEGRTILRFTFLDPNIVPIPDDRPNSYSFRIQDQTIGVVALTPGGNGTDAPSSFLEWYGGIGDTIDMGEQKVPVQKMTVGDHEALGFALQNDNDAAENLMTEIDGQVLWLQTHAARDYLTRFVEQVTSVEAI